MKQKLSVFFRALSILGILSALFLTTQSTGPRHNLAPRFDDHQSHWSSVPLFFEYGYGIYQKPTGQFCDPSTPPADVCVWGGRPTLINWPEMPRPYPFLDYFIHAPWGLGYRAGIWTTSSANQGVILTYLFGFLLFWMVVLKCSRDSREQTPLLSGVFLSILYFEGLKYSWYGFYDVFAVLSIVASLWAGLKKKRPDLALLFFGLSTAIHFRSWWYFPLAGLWGIQWAIGLKPSLDLRRAFIGMIGITLAIASAVSLWMILPFAQKMGANQPFYAPLLLESSVGWIFLPLITLVILGLAYLGNGILVLAMLGVACFTLSTNYAMFWHSFFLFPLLVIWFLTSENREKTTSRLSALAVLVVYLFLARFEFGARPWSLKSFAQEVVEYSHH